MGITHKEYEILKANLKRKGAKPKPSLRDKPVGKTEVKEENPTRSIVRIQSFGCRPLDIDNLYGGVKFVVDGLRYAGIISGDSEADIELHVSQTKVKTKAEERTEVEVIK